MEEFFRLVERLPTNRKKRFPGLSFAQAAEKTSDGSVKSLSFRTQQSYQRELHRFLKWCRRKGILGHDPFELLERRRRTQGDKHERVPYTPEELITIFNAPIYTGCVDDEFGFNRIGQEKPRRGRFWLPLLGLYTGARAGELCQLRVKDFMATNEGTPFVRICAEESWMRLKTRNAARDIPIHSKLMKIGFRDFVAHQHANGESLLFPEMIVEGKSPSYRFSKLYGTFRKSLGLKRTGLDFHSFRHSARQALRRVDVLHNAGSRVDEQIDEMFGWAEGKKMSSRYGKGFPVDELSKLYGPPQRLDSFGTDLSYSPAPLIGFHHSFVTPPRLSAEGPGVSPGRRPTAFLDISCLVSRRHGHCVGVGGCRR